ncbi:hypothetical protein D9C73_028524 [Collichthys lucidus]|uniref:Uncharacterized protein n=1 Tax=Collichthys lucidus TaxID=240159 RepID=A0A4U5TUD4_COLLU|nr:hypothetical protein D9C73_028524 [Collichthys lucidus]
MSKVQRLLQQGHDEWYVERRDLYHTLLYEAHTAGSASSQKGILSFARAAATYTPLIAPSPLPSARVLRRAHLIMEIEKMPMYRHQLLSVTGEILCIDGTRKALKKIYGDGQGTMQYVTSVLNEWGQFVTTAVVVAAAAESEGCYACMARGLIARFRCANAPGVQLYVSVKVVVLNGVWLNKYRCRRGSNYLEGLHAHLFNAFGEPTEEPAIYLQERTLFSPVLVFDGSRCLLAIGNTPVTTFAKEELGEELFASLTVHQTDLASFRHRTLVLCSGFCLVRSYQTGPLVGEMETTKNPHTRGDSRLCCCGNRISGRDTHPVCSTCLGVDHARLALEIPGSCGHCKVFTVKSLRRRLARQASLADRDPFLPTADLGAAAEEDEVMAGEVPETGYDWAAQCEQLRAPPFSDADRDPSLPAADLGAAAEEDEVMAGEVPETGYDWAPQCEQLRAPPFSEEDVLEIGLTEDDDDASFLISEDEGEDDTSVAPALAVKPKLPESTNREEGGVSSPAPSLHVDLLSTCKRAAEKLEVPWPAAVAEPTGSRYEGKRLALARSAVKQLLPVFPELLAELSKTWNYCPYSNRSPISGAASLDCEVMEAQGLLLMPPVEAPVAAHLCPGSTSQLSAASSRRPTLPTKPERFQSALAERAYKAAALSARALSALSILTAYQAELFGASADEQDPDAWEEMAVIADLSLRIQRVSVQATGRVMATLVIQGRARWLSLANLTDRERDDILDMPIVPEGVFGSALATMQQRCEAKKKDNEALKLCLPRKAPTPSPPVQRKSFAQAASQPPHFKMPKRPQQLGPSLPPRREPGAGWHRKSPASTAVPPPPPAAAASVPQARKKKRAA